jgi:4-alpha-glucanotransferase
MSGLEELAARCGIEAAFLDAHGQIRETKAETRHALLAAMGFAVDGEASAEVELTKLDHIEWKRKLAPVFVLRRGDTPLFVALTLPAATKRKIVWRLQLEGDVEETGEISFHNLVLLEQKLVSGVAYERRRFELRDDIPFGYHRLSVDGGDETTLIVTPEKCWLPPQIIDSGRVWGVAAQLYLLRSTENWGIGDFDDLRHLVDMLAERGADVVGLNPLHAMFLDSPEHASPYSPETRLMLNVLNIKVERIPEFATSAEAQALVASEGFQQALKYCRAQKLVDYSGVSKLKMDVLRLVFETSYGNQDTVQWYAFEKFRRGAGDVLQRGCVFEALRAHFADGAPEHADWHTWPKDFRDPNSDAVARFANDHAEKITFRAWLQFNADQQLRAAAEAAKRMAIGLYRDLAVGADPSGAETWANYQAVVDRAEVGAPPDIYNPAGQSWGLPPFNPRVLREEAYRSFIDLVRTNMRHAGGLRIDHVMALQHLYWIPKGMSPADGAYVGYPLVDLIGILALESHRNHCLVVGEDLGTVPDGFRERMAEANILSYRVLFFEKEENGFRQPADYPELALAVAGSHDLPTLRGWWEARDIELKESLRLYPTPKDIENALQERERDRNELVKALKSAGFPIEEKHIDVEKLVFAANGYLARSRSALSMLQIDDMTGEVDPVNVPGTSDEHPNWRRRLSLSLEELANCPGFNALARLYQSERGDGTARD